MSDLGRARARRDFALLWAAQTVSLFGSLITRTALPFVAILVLDARPLEVALLSACELVPGLVLGLAAGAAVDRRRRRHLLIAADLGRAALLGLVPAAALTGLLRIELLYAVAFLGGLLGTVFDIAWNAYVPALVGNEELVAANSKLAATAAVAEVASFGAGGLIVQALTAPFAIAIDALSFAASALLVYRIRTPEPPPHPSGAREPIARALAAGARSLAAESRLAVLAAAGTLQALANGVFGAVFLLFVSRELGLAPATLGFVFAAGGISSGLGAVLAGSAGRRLGAGRAIAAGLVTAGLACLLVPLARATPALAVVLLLLQQLLGDGALTVSDVHLLSLRQALTPDALRGRVGATLHILERGAMLAGTLAGGLVGEHAGLAVALVLGSLIRVAAGAGVAISPVRNAGRIEGRAGF